MVDRDMGPVNLQQNKNLFPHIYVNNTAQRGPLVNAPPLCGLAVAPIYNIFGAT